MSLLRRVPAQCDIRQQGGDFRLARATTLLEALAAAGSNHAALLALASNASFTAPAGFDFANAFATVVANNGTQTGGAGPPPAGSGNLLVQVTAAGVTTSINVGVVPLPASQSEFCNDITSDPTFTDIGAAGTFTVTGCSFSGRVGTITGNLAIAGLGAAIPYSYRYDYQ